MPEILQLKDLKSTPNPNSNEVLRQVAKEVPVDSITSAKIKKILKEMSLALSDQEDGVAIAAPQIGYSLRIFLVAGKVLEAAFIEDRENRLANKKPIDEVVKVKNHKDLIFINPVVSKLSREKEWMPEGCLSVRWLYGQVRRSKKAFCEAYDENGKKFKMGASGLMAQIFQHETDHLNGVLFVDHAKDIKEELPNKLKS